jgi:hypothetical protein
MQDHGARRDRFFTLETVDLEHWRTRPTAGGKALSDGVQPSHRAAVVVFVVAHAQSLRKPIHPLGLEQERPDHNGSGRAGRAD